MWTQLRAGVLEVHGVGGAAFQWLDENRDRQGGSVRQETGARWSGSELKSTNSSLNSVQTPRMVVSVKVRIAWVNTGRRCWVTNARWGCSSETLCRARR
jgi:hypothetical protein